MIKDRFNIAYLKIICTASTISRHLKSLTETERKVKFFIRGKVSNSYKSKSMKNILINFSWEGAGKNIFNNFEAAHVENIFCLQQSLSTSAGVLIVG